MTELFENFYVGDEDDCHSLKNETDFFVVHAAKNPCHLEGVGYTGNLDKSHPYYLVYKTKKDLYLNIVDLPSPLKPEFGDPIFNKAIHFIDDRYHKTGKSRVLVHCNEGKSRGPSIALAFMAWSGKIDSISYEHATNDFKKIYPAYEPGKGVAHYLENNWEKLMNC